MFRLSFSFLPPFCFLLLLMSCRDTAVVPNMTSQARPSVDTISVTEVSTEGAVTFNVVDGVVYWSGQPAFGNPHNGTIRVSGGKLMVNQDQLISGTVTIDMQSITVTDLADGGEQRDLEGHLKHPDFFDAIKYPIGEFKFDEVLPSNLPDFNWVISGSLTLKGKSNPVNIPVKISINGDELVAQSPTFSINRTQWGINFRSGLLGTAKDKIIQDVIILSLKLKAKKTG